jgi:hypothetical protein
MPQRDAEEYPFTLSAQDRQAIMEHVELPLPLLHKMVPAKPLVNPVLLLPSEVQTIVAAIQKAVEQGQIRSTAELQSLVPFLKQAMQHMQKAARSPTVAEKAPLPLRGRTKPIEAPTPKQVLAKSPPLYQFKITLLNVTPKIWRRVLLHDCRLSDFDTLIQAVMGWQGCHMHRFIIDEESYSDPEMLDDLDVLDECDFWLSEIIPDTSKKFKFKYEYDFGDGWMHEVLFEKCGERERGQKYPLCIAGARACPPEDCGGPWGFHNYLDIITNPQHPEYEEMLEWIGPYDPLAFNAERVSANLSGRK